MSVLQERRPIGTMAQRFAALFPSEWFELPSTIYLSSWKCMLRPVKNKLFITCILGFIVTAGCLMAACAVDADALVTTLFDVDQGLPQSSVKDILQGRNGDLWVATQEGLARFDGQKFSVYNTRNTPGLVSNNLHQLLEDGSGDLWILAGSGVTRYHDGDFQNMTPDCDQNGNRINYIFKSVNGRIYAASDSQFLVGSKNGFVQLAPTKGFLTAGPWYLAEQNDGTVWASSAGRHMISVRGDAVRRYIVPGKNGDEIGGLAVDRTGTLWIGGTGLWRVNGRTMEPYKVPGPWTKQHFDALSAHDGVIWFTIKGLVYSIAPGDRAPKSWGGPKLAVRWTAFQDDGTIWQLLMNGSREAVWSFRNGHASQFDVPGQVTTEWTLPVRSGCVGNVWVGTYSGLAEIRKARCQTFAAGSGLPMGDVKAVYQTRGGDIYADVDGRSFGSLNDGTFTPSTDPNLHAVDISSMADDADGNLWVSTYNNKLWMKAPGKAAVNVRFLVVLSSSLVSFLLC